MLPVSKVVDAEEDEGERCSWISGFPTLVLDVVDLEWNPWQHGAAEGPSSSSTRGAHQRDLEVAPTGFDGQL
ncbi:unnamed protein product [Urochloa humidicola]